jgi:hypothetical protein
MMTPEALTAAMWPEEQAQSTGDPAPKRDPLLAALWPEEEPQQPESGPVDAVAAALWPEVYGQGDRG